MNINWDNILLSIQLELETDELLSEITEMLEVYKIGNKCIECGAWASVKFNELPYCLSCYAENTGNVTE